MVYAVAEVSFAAEAVVLTAVDVPGVPAMAGVSAVFAFPTAVDISSATGVVSVPALLASLLWLKVHKHEIFCDFFAETETIWSQGPVTRDF